MTTRRPTRLNAEQIEDRVVPTTGLAWPGSSSLTMSFVPDGADITGTANQLSAHLNGEFSNNTAAWKKEIARAFQTWVTAANLNVGFVPDNGQALGVAGAVKGDTRFGDFRVGARPLTTGGTADALAVASGYDTSGSTWTGDVFVNTAHGFTNAADDDDDDDDDDVDYDLFSALVHEAGHSLGLLHNASPSSVMYDGYARRTNLAAADVAAVQALYGARPKDAFDLVASNGTRGTATPLVWAGVPLQVSGDITTTSDVDHYKFRTLLVGETDVRVRVKTAGLSFLTPNLQVYRGDTQVRYKATTDPFNGDLVVTLGSSYVANTEYTIRVAGHGANVFNRGAYQLMVEPTTVPLSPPPAPAATSYPDHGTNDTLDTATGMTATAARTQLNGSVETAADVDYYSFGGVQSVTGTRLFTATVATLDATKLLPTVELVDQAGNPIATTVIINENGTFTVEAVASALANVETIYLAVSAANPAGTKVSGNYVVTGDLRSADPTTFAPVKTGSVTTAAPTQWTGLSVGEARLVRFSLDATTPAGAAATALGMTIFNAAGTKVFSFSDVAGGTLTTGSVWLPQGSYTIGVVARTDAGAVAASASYVLKKIELGDPVDPYPDGTGGGAGSPPVVTVPPTVPPPPPTPPSDPWEDQDPDATP